MSPRARRLLLYGTTALAAGVLGWLGFLHEPPPDPMTRLTGARMLAGVGDFDAALEVCDIVAAENPGCFEERLFRSAILAQAARYEEALPVYDEALAKAPAEAVRRDLLQDRATVLLALGRRDAFDATRAELAADSDDHRPHLLDATLAEREGRWIAAIQAYGRALQCLPGDAQGGWIRGRVVRNHVQAGREALDAGQPVRALRHFDLAVDLSPQDLDARLEGAHACLAGGRPDDAIARVLTAAETNPKRVARRLRDDATWVPLLGDPRIEALVSNRDT